MRRGGGQEGAGAAARSKRKVERRGAQGRRRRARRERGPRPSRRRAHTGCQGPSRGWRGLCRRGPGAGAPGGVCSGRSRAGPRPLAGGPGGGERAALRGWPWPSSSAWTRRAPPPRDLPSSAGRSRASLPSSAPLAAQSHIVFRFGCVRSLGRGEFQAGRGAAETPPASVAWFVRAPAAEPRPLLRSSGGKAPRCRHRCRR